VRARLDSVRDLHGRARRRANGEALDWIENAVRRGYLNYPLLAVHDPLLEPARAEPRFKALLEAVRPQWEWPDQRRTPPARMRAVPRHPSANVEPL
jgi:hypothetical protein